MSKSALEILAPSLEKLPAAQRAVVESFSPAELELAAKMQLQLEEAAPDVTGQGNVVHVVC